MSFSHPEDQIEEIVAIDPAQTLEIAIENQNGDVLVRGTDRTDVLVRAEKHGNRGSAAYQDAELLIETDDARIVVRPVLPDQGRSGGPSVTVDLGLDLDLGFLNDLLGQHRKHPDHVRRRQERRERKGRGFAVTWDGTDVSYEIEIDVPRSLLCRLGVNTASGDVKVADILGEIRINTASGDIDLKQLTGDLHVQTASGDLRVQHAAGQVEGRSASGDARIEQSALNALGFHTASGDLDLDAALTGDGPYRIESVSGDTQLAVVGIDPATGRERQLAILFQSMSGDARLDNEFQPRGSGQWITGGNDAGPTITVKSVSGDLRGSLGASRGAASLARRASELANQDEPAAAASPEAPRAPEMPSAPGLPPLPEMPPAPPRPVTPAPTPVAQPIAQAESEAASDPEPDATPAMAAADRLALLEAVERGEIDIEEALQRLEGRANQDPESK